MSELEELKWWYCWACKHNMIVNHYMLESITLKEIELHQQGLLTTEFTV